MAREVGKTASGRLQLDALRALEWWLSFPQAHLTWGRTHLKKVEFDSEGPVHQVTISVPFAVGKIRGDVFGMGCLCCQAGGCGGYRPDDTQGWGTRESSSHPVVCVSWEDANAFVRLVVERDRDRITGYCYQSLSGSMRRVQGRQARFTFGSTISTDQANYDGNYTYGNGRKGVYRQRTVPVGSFPFEQLWFA